MTLDHSVLDTRYSVLTEQAPTAWQDIAGKRVTVVARYVMSADGAIGFELGKYDPNYPLTIDPTLTYSTYLGGYRDDAANAIAVDATGNVVVAGDTSSMNFPTRAVLTPASP